MKEIVNLFANKLCITPAQFLAIYKAISQCDRKKASFYQVCALTEQEKELIKQCPKAVINVLEDEGTVQAPIDTFNIIADYEDELYFLEHDNDEIEELGIDIETYSSVDLLTSGVYPYAESDDFEILLFAYSVNKSPVRVVDVASGQLLPDRIKRALTDEKVLKTAYNAAFERVCISKWLGVWLSPEQWDCTMVRAARLGLPLSLAQCGAVLGLTQQKMTEGKALITYFSKPCRPTKANGGRTRNLPCHAPEKWATFVMYNKRDVEVEQAIRRKVERLTITNTEREAWLLDQRINDRGVLCDLDMARRASDMDDEYREGLIEEAKQITGLENPSSVSQLKTWLKQETGVTFTSLDKAAVIDALPKINSAKALRVLKIRQELGKSSTAKYKTMLNCACKDGRIRGLFQFYGANRTGRFAGRLVQLQNLPQNHIPDIDYARNLVKTGTLSDLEFEYSNVPQTLSELIRTAFIAEKGHTFHVCDFSAIEARVIAWIAGEDWVLDVFRTGGDIYCATASKMFGVPVEKHGVNSELRQKGKIATLALGYGGGINALKAMGGERMGLTDAEMEEIVVNWRAANPNIVKLWKHMEQAARAAVKGEALPIEKGLLFKRKWGGVSLTLPSKREIFYPRMFLDETENRLKFEGSNQTTKTWDVIETYAGKLTENAVQSIARDCLIETMLNLDKAGYNIVFHVHDEAIIEATPDQKLEDIAAIFGREIPWAKGLPLKGAGYTTPYYLKD